MELLREALRRARDQFCDVWEFVTFAGGWTKHHLHALLHFLYFTGVAVEGHGLYTMFAGSLAIATLFILLGGEEA